MPEISRFYGIIIKMYFADHNPPQFHAEYLEFKAEYDIRTLIVLAGKLPNKVHSLVIEWHHCTGRNFSITGIEQLLLKN